MQQFEGRTQENHIVRYFRFNAAESQRCKRSSLEFCIHTDLCHASIMLSVICLFLNLFYMIRCSLVLAAKWCVQLAVLNYSKKHSQGVPPFLIGGNSLGACLQNRSQSVISQMSSIQDLFGNWFFFFSFVISPWKTMKHQPEVMCRNFLNWAKSKGKNILFPFHFLDWKQQYWKTSSFLLP